MTIEQMVAVRVRRRMRTSSEIACAQMMPTSCIRTDERRRQWTISETMYIELNWRASHNCVGRNRDFYLPQTENKLSTASSSSSSHANSALIENENERNWLKWREKDEICRESKSWIRRRGRGTSTQTASEWYIATNEENINWIELNFVVRRNDWR